MVPFAPFIERPGGVDVKVPPFTPLTVTNCGLVTDLQIGLIGYEIVVGGMITKFAK